MAWVESGLGTNVFLATKEKFFPKSFQPLDFLSSWPLFALSHHFVVWLASDEVYTERVLRDYALLGDNIVIADERVATVYRRVMDELGVKISLSKFLISKSGAMEFAKGFFVGTRDFFYLYL